MKLKFNFYIIWLFALGILAACTEAKDCCVPPPNESFLPLAIGNYWRVNADDYMEVTGKTNLNGNEYFVLSSFIKDVPNPAFSRDTFYVQIDEKIT